MKPRTHHCVLFTKLVVRWLAFTAACNCAGVALAPFPGSRHPPASAAPSLRGRENSNPKKKRGKFKKKIEEKTHHNKKALLLQQLVLGIRLRASLNATVWLQRKRTGLTQLQKMVVEVEEAGIFVM